MRLHVRDPEALERQEGIELRRKLALRTDVDQLLEREEARKHHTWLQPGEFIDLFGAAIWIVMVRKTLPAQLLFGCSFCRVSSSPWQRRSPPVGSIGFCCCLG
ncbi:MAG: hypothetical protein R3E79_08455 [Caldilineaceae bacterium]